MLYFNYTFKRDFNNSNFEYPILIQWIHVISTVSSVAKDTRILTAANWPVSWNQYQGANVGYARNYKLTCSYYSGNKTSVTISLYNCSSATASSDLTAYVIAIGY